MTVDALTINDDAQGEGDPQLLMPALGWVISPSPGSDVVVFDQLSSAGLNEDPDVFTQASPRSCWVCPLAARAASDVHPCRTDSQSRILWPTRAGTWQTWRDGSTHPHSDPCRPTDLMAVRPPSPASGPLVLADISGYTSFLRDVANAHPDAFTDGAIPEAYAVISSLLDGIIERLTPPFTLSKIEGDAVFAFAVGGDVVPTGAALLECMAECYRTFQETLNEARSANLCTCGVCTRDNLDLKIILHAGPFVMQSIGGGQELSGPDVVMAHLLLKTDVGPEVGHGGYALITDAAATRFDIPTDASLPLVETFPHYPPIDLHVFRLAAAA